MSDLRSCREKSSDRRNRRFRLLFHQPVSGLRDHHAGDIRCRIAHDLRLGSGGFNIRALLAWAAVGIPLAWGIWITLQKALVLFQ